MSTWNQLMSLLSNLGQAQTTAAGGATPPPTIPMVPPQPNAPTFMSRAAQLQPDVVHPLDALANLVRTIHAQPGRSLQAATPLGGMFDVTANPWRAFNIGHPTNPLLQDITTGNLGATLGDIWGGTIGAIKAEAAGEPGLPEGFLPPKLKLPEIPVPEIPKGYPTRAYKQSWNPLGGSELNPELLPGWEPDISKIKIPGFTKEQIVELGDRFERYVGTKLTAQRLMNKIKNDPVRVKSMMQEYGIIPPDVIRYRPEPAR